jgi:hypothetical protein
MKRAQFDIPARWTCAALPLRSPIHPRRPIQSILFHAGVIVREVTPGRGR